MRGFKIFHVSSWALLCLSLAWLQEVPGAVRIVRYQICLAQAPIAHCCERTSMKIFWTPCGSTFEGTLGSKPAGCQASRKQCRKFEVGAGPCADQPREAWHRRSRKHWQKQKVFPGVSRVCEIWSESWCVFCWILLGFYLGGSSEWLSCETHLVPL